MKAARIQNFGGPEVIVLEDVPRPMTTPDASDWRRTGASRCCRSWAVECADS
jgi:hypothetical protein